LYVFTPVDVVIKIVKISKDAWTNEYSIDDLINKLNIINTKGLSWAINLYVNHLFVFIEHNLSICIYKYMCVYICSYKNGPNALLFFMLKNLFI